MLLKLKFEAAKESHDFVRPSTGIRKQLAHSLPLAMHSAEGDAGLTDHQSASVVN